ncbi:MAG: hypothetical protein NVS9B8_12060 [Candidatus Limnocylindrales bacterium]
MDVPRLIARTLRSTRLRLAWSQRTLSIRSGVPQSQISRIERRQLPGLRLSTIDRLFAATGVRYRLVLDPPHLDQRRQTDLVHARCSAYVGRRLKRAGWLVAREVEIGDGRSRGWIDLLAYDPRSRVLLVIEIKTEIHDLGQIERSMNWYQRESVGAARRLDWRPRRIGSALLVLHSAANESVVMSNREVMAASFPGRAANFQDVVSGAAEGPGAEVRHMAMIDPRSHRIGWLRPTRIDGRRSPAPYRDYLDAVRALESRGSRAM